MPDNAFFDVLVDQIIRDVRNEFEGLHPNQKTESQPVRPVGDLVAQLLDFRLRLASQPQTGQAQLATNRARSHSKEWSDRRTSQSTRRPSDRQTQMEMILGASHQDMDRIAGSPGFDSQEANTAFQTIARHGAKFQVRDFEASKILPEALKRERRRLLLSLHPDRHPESEKRAAHVRFLEVAEAFSTLAERAMAQTDQFAA